MTLRQQIADMLRQPRTISSVAHELKLTREGVEEHLKHPLTTAKAADQAVKIEPARGPSGGYTVGTDKVTKPSKCPDCKGRGVCKTFVRVKATGIAIRSGESVLVTKVRVKDKLIEFQLAGGGFGTFGDDTSSSVSVPSVSKSNRERDLERLVKDETDRDQKRRLQRELDDLRNDRQREDGRNRAAAVTAEEAKKTRIATTRLHSGSRFNIRYNEGVPRGLGPDGVMRALAEYVDFPFARDRP